MRNEFSEPMGMQVRRCSGKQETLEFAAFVSAIERGDVQPEDEVRSHIVTQDQWVRVGEMRIYQEVMKSVEGKKAVQEGIWPPPPQWEWPDTELPGHSHQ